MIYNLKRVAHQAMHNASLGQRLPLHWYASQNWGDALNPVLAKFLSGQEVRYTRIKYCEAFLSIGSVLGLANSRTTVWGSGFIDFNQTVKDIPKKIYAVRGPLTRKKLLNVGIDCPEVFGDPALLLPYFYNRPVTKKYRLGIIPHFCDFDHHWVNEISSYAGVRVINVNSDIFDFVDEVQSCEYIASSSLHGLICADAYGIPNIKVKLTNKVEGGNFKFMDYAASVGRIINDDLTPEKVKDPEKIINYIKKDSIDCDLKLLLQSCPFMSSNLRNKVDKIDSCDLSLASLRKLKHSTLILK